MPRPTNHPPDSWGPMIEIATAVLPIAGNQRALPARFNNTATPQATNPTRMVTITTIAQPTALSSPFISAIGVTHNHRMSPYSTSATIVAAPIIMGPLILRSKTAMLLSECLAPLFTEHGRTSKRTPAGCTALIWVCARGHGAQEIRCATVSQFIACTSDPTKRMPCRWCCCTAWPGGVIEFLDLIGPLTDPVAHGGNAESLSCRDSVWPRVRLLSSTHRNRLEDHRAFG